MMMEWFRLFGVVMAVIGFNPSIVVDWVEHAPVKKMSVKPFVENQLLDTIDAKAIVVAPDGTVYDANVPFTIMDDNNGASSLLMPNGIVSFDSTDTSVFYTDNGLLGNVDVIVDNEQQLVTAFVSITDGDQTQSFTVTLSRLPNDPTQAKAIVVSDYDGSSIEATLNPLQGLVSIDKIQNASIQQAQDFGGDTGEILFACFGLTAGLGLLICGGAVVVITVAIVAKETTGCPFYCFGLCDGIGAC